MAETTKQVPQNQSETEDLGDKVIFKIVPVWKEFLICKQSISCDKCWQNSSESGDQNPNKVFRIQDLRTHGWEKWSQWTPWQVNIDHFDLFSNKAREGWSIQLELKWDKRTMIYLTWTQIRKEDKGQFYLNSILTKEWWRIWFKIK